MYDESYQAIMKNSMLNTTRAGDGDRPLCRGAGFGLSLSLCLCLAQQKEPRNRKMKISSKHIYKHH